MCTALDGLQREYRGLLRHGIIPTGLLIDRATLSSICSEAHHDDPRVEWGETGPDRLFGFQPQLVESVAPRFTSRSRSAATERSRPFNLADLRAL